MAMAASTTTKRDLRRYESALTLRGFSPVVGVDEAGRGACAGPLVVAAVVLGDDLTEVNDSKALTPRRRETLFDTIMSQARAVSVVVVEPAEVDELGVHHADLEGMRRAIARLAVVPQYALTDGYPIKGLPIPSLAVWKGDQVCASVAAASIIAKVTRDRIMCELDQQFPEYGFAAHKGYVTAAHRQALIEHGPKAIHRYSFAPVISAAHLHGSKISSTVKSSSTRGASAKDKVRT